MTTETTEATENVTDIQAPYGRKADGTPKKKPGPSRGAPLGGPRRKTPTPPRQTTRKTSVDYSPGILGIAQALSLPLTMSRSTLPDAWAIQNAAPGIASALNQLAQDRPEVAAMLDRILAAGPYGALIAAVIPMLVQIAANHRLIPQNLAMQLGAVAPEDIIEHLRQERAGTEDGTQG